MYYPTILILIFILIDIEIDIDIEKSWLSALDSTCLATQVLLSNRR